MTKVRAEVSPPVDLMSQKNVLYATCPVMRKNIHHSEKYKFYYYFLSCDSGILPAQLLLEIHHVLVTLRKVRSLGLHKVIQAS